MRGTSGLHWWLGSRSWQKNGYHINLRDQALIDTVDRAGVAAATLDDLFAVTEGLLTKARSDRKGWAGVVDSVVASNREYLTSLAA